MKLLLISLFIASSSLQSIAQRIVENKIDEFTGSTVITTSNHSLFVKGLGTEGASYRLQKIDGITILRMRYGRSKVFSVPEGGSIIFLLENGETFTMRSTDYRISEPNSTSDALVPNWSASISYVSEDDPTLETLEANRVSKIRIYLSDEYEDYEIKPKIAAILQRAVKLVNETSVRGSR